MDLSLEYKKLDFEVVITKEKIFKGHGCHRVRVEGGKYFDCVFDGYTRSSCKMLGKWLLWIPGLLYLGFPENRYECWKNAGKTFENYSGIVSHFAELVEKTRLRYPFADLLLFADANNLVNVIEYITVPGILKKRQTFLHRVPCNHTFRHQTLYVRDAIDTKRDNDLASAMSKLCL